MIPKKYLILIAISGLIIVLDQLTKMYIHNQFQLGEIITVIPEFFNITYVRNPGAAFGIFRDSSETFRSIFFLSMPAIAIVIILTLLHGLPDSEKAQIYALSGIFGGAIGNYIDRIRFGYVIDFLDFHIQNKYVWPAFNVADSAIVVGVSVLIYLMLVQWRQEVREKKAKS